MKPTQSTKLHHPGLINVLEFSIYMSFISLVKYISRYFILVDAIVNCIIFFNSVSGSSLLLYRITKFCALMLYPVILLNLFINSKSFN